MITISHRMTVPAGPAEALAYVADFRNLREWDPTVVTARATSEGDFRLGAGYLVELRSWGTPQVVRYEVAGYEPGAWAVLEGSARSFSTVDTIEVEPAGGGAGRGPRCTLRYRVEIRLYGLARAAEPAVAWLVERSVHGAFQRLAARFERRTAA